jgi:hypothetical protein
MKKLILLLGLLFIWFICSGQNYQYEKRANNIYNYKEKITYYVPAPDTIKLINITNNQIENGWSLSGYSCAGCPSFYYKILRSEIPFKAEDEIYYYYFYFYFYSNSFYSDKTLTYTYLGDINFYINSQYIFELPYLLIEPKKVIYGAWMRHINPESNVSFKAIKVNVH